MFAIAVYPIFLAIDAFIIARREHGSTCKWYQRWWLYFGMFAVFYSLNFLTAITIKEYIAESFAVPGRAMAPTIFHMDRILVDKIWSSAESLRRDDIVVCRSAGAGSPLFVMRVLGLPGETIEIKNRVVYINKKQIDDNHAVHEDEPPPDTRLLNFGPTTIPQRSFFVLGDNRSRSYDSRILGTIPFADYYGSAKTVILSRDYELQNPNDLSTSIPKAIRWDRVETNLKSHRDRPSLDPLR